MPHPTRSLGRMALLVLALTALWPLMPSRSTDAAEPKLVTIDAEDAYLPSVLRILAEKGELNIITGPGVSGERLSIHIRNVPVDQAVDLVVRAAGLAYERIGNSIMVANPQALKQEAGRQSYVVDLKYADASQVKAALGSLAADIQVDRGGNRLVVVTSPRVIAEIRDIVGQLDVPSRQVMLEARVVEVSTDDAKRLGIDWSQLSRQGVTLIEGSGDTTSIGGRITNTPGTWDILRFRNFSRDPMVFRVALDMLIRDGNARVLAQPKIATLNGHEATMLIGSRIPFTVTGTVFAGGAAAPTERIEREEVGVKLNITPLINADGYITTTIRPEVSTVTGFAGRNADLPIVSTREATTTVRLKDGNSVIIGGLLNEEKISTVTKVPLLGSIPGIGYLFQHHNTRVVKTDLVIEVTPRILPDQQ